MLKGLFVQKIIILGLIVAIGWLLFNISLRYSADERIRHIESTISAWEAGKEIPEDEEWDRLKYKLGVLVQKNSNNPIYWTLLGDLHYWRAYQQRLFVDSAAQQIKQAVAYYTEAAHRRPPQALPWIKIARAESFNNHSFNQRIEIALLRALRLGKYERDIQRDLVRMVFSYWDDLGSQAKKETLSMLKSAVNEPMMTRYILVNAVEYRKEALVIPAIHRPKDRELMMHLIKKRDNG